MKKAANTKAMAVTPRVMIENKESVFDSRGRPQ